MGHLSAWQKDYTPSRDLIYWRKKLKGDVMRKEVHLEGPEYEIQNMTPCHVQWQHNVWSVTLNYFVWFFLYFCCHYRAGLCKEPQVLYPLFWFHWLNLQKYRSSWLFGGAIYRHSFELLLNFSQVFKCYFKSWFPKLIKHWKACGICNVDDAVHKVMLSLTSLELWVLCLQTYAAS